MSSWFTTVIQYERWETAAIMVSMFAAGYATRIELINRRRRK